MRRFSALCWIAAMSVAACGPRSHVNVVAAASLRQVVEAAVASAAAGEPAVRIQTGGSAALARRVVELDLQADVLLLADGELFDEQLAGWSDFWIGFATDRLVIAYTDASRFAAQIDAQSWPQILLRPEVDVAIADPDLAPVGYRTMQALRLWDLEHAQDPVADRVLAAARSNVRPDVAEMLAPLQVGAVDYAFLYGSTARLAGLRVVELPAAVNLGDPSRATDYARVEVDVAGPTPATRVARRGAPIVFGAAVRRGAPAAAVALLRWILGPAGRAVLVESGLSADGITVHGAIDAQQRLQLGLSETSTAPR